MGKVVMFPVPIVREPLDVELDLFSAIDFAIRDLRDIAELCGNLAARQQAHECREMLEDALEAALRR